MTFISKNIFRKCKYCEKEVCKTYYKNKWNSYAETCGSEICKNQGRKNRIKKKKCKYCDNICERTEKSGNLTTCGSLECLKKSHKNRSDKIEGLRRKNPKKILCKLCSEEFTSIRPPHLKYCIDCVPNQTWRKRAGKYGIGKKQWDVILKKQYETCALCDNEPTVVDHCHNENRVRGLLCHSCNINIMIFDKQDEFVKKAIKYIGKSYV